MRILRLTQDIITDRLPMKGSGDIVHVDSDFADHLLSLGVAVEIKVNAPVARAPVEVEKKTPMPVSPPAQVLPEPIVRKRGRHARK